MLSIYFVIFSWDLSLSFFPLFFAFIAIPNLSWRRVVLGGNNQNKNANLYEMNPKELRPITH